MNNTVIEPGPNFDFSSIYLSKPVTNIEGLGNNAHFTKIIHGNKSLYIQTPPCLTKKGMIKNEKKMYADLMFTNQDIGFIEWIENLESHCQTLIHSHKEWFESPLTLDDIEGVFTSSLKFFKSGKNYLLRTNINNNIRIYDENYNLLSYDQITPEQSIICLLEIKGIKFTSRSFQIDYDVKQSLLVTQDPFLDQCVIKYSKKTSSDPKTNDNIDQIDSKAETTDPITNDPITNDIGEPEINDIDSTMTIEELTTRNTEMNTSLLSDNHITSMEKDELPNNNNNNILSKPLALDQSTTFGQALDLDQSLALDDDLDLEEFVNHDIVMLDDDLEESNKDELIEDNTFDLLDEEPIEINRPEKIYQTRLLQATTKAKEAQEQIDYFKSVLNTTT